MTELLPTDSNDGVVRDLLMRWMIALSNEDWDGASAMLLLTGWSAEKLRRRIVNYGADDPIDDEPPATPTDPRVAKTSEDYPRPQFSIDRDALGPLSHSSYVAWIHLDLPIDGYWSDLTAQFGLRRLEPGQLALELLRIRVM